MRKLALLLALWLAACGEEDTQLAATQVTLTVQTDTPLRGKLDNLRVSLFVNTQGSWTRRSSLDLPSSQLRWPLDIPILARAGDESAQIEVIVEAYASGQRLAQSRVITRFAPGRLAPLETQLFACPGRAAGFVCAEDSCHGEACAVCAEGGECVAVASPSVMDAGPADDASTRDATTADAGITPAQDAATDAGATPASCPANACAAPYACLPTPSGYTCRGQFADWPMPDKTPGAKTKPNYTATPDLVTDNVTKLQWQLGLPRIYPGCTEYVEYGNGTKGDTGELCTRAQGKAYCENLLHGGFDDWRMPTVIELISLLDLTQEGGDYAIDPAAFADTAFGPFVSDSTYAGAPSQHWGVNYYARQTYYASNYSGKIRCVRAGAVPSFATPAERYLVADDKVTDQATGLVWQRAPSATKFAVAETDAGLPLVSSACSPPWRLPTTNELFTLIDFSRSKPAIRGDAFPNTPSGLFWGVPGAYENIVDFETGELLTYEDAGFVRCVQ
jgi:hypothetical protein